MDEEVIAGEEVEVGEVVEYRASEIGTRKVALSLSSSPS